jgi:hypothetical protein
MGKLNGSLVVQQKDRQWSWGKQALINIEIINKTYSKIPWDVLLCQHPEEEEETAFIAPILG